MSKFCGKCDVYDSFIMIKELNDDTNWNNYKFSKYTKNKSGDLEIESLEINSIRDLVPYFSFIECCGGGKKDNYSCILTSSSFVDIEEKEILLYTLKDIKRIYRKYKRLNKEFIPENVAKEILLFNHTNDYAVELCKRVKNHPYTNDISGIHIPSYNYYRDSLMNEMIKYNYTKSQAYEWCYNNKKTW